MSKIVLVTGANRGLGLSVIEVSGQRYSSDTYILAARNIEDGKNAKAELEQKGVKAPIDVVELDVTNDVQILALVEYVSTKYGKLDVLVNNAGIISVMPDMTIQALRYCTTEMLNVNMTSVACVTWAFLPLLRKATKPRVINVTSGLGSIQRTMTTQMTRYPPYGFSKVGLNGITAHFQAMENDRISQIGAEQSVEGFIRFYSIAPGLLKTAFSNFNEAGIDPKVGAEIIVRLIGDDEGEYQAGSHLECKDGLVRDIPW